MRTVTVELIVANIATVFMYTIYLISEKKGRCNVCKALWSNKYIYKHNTNRPSASIHGEIRHPLSASKQYSSELT